MSSRDGRQTNYNVVRYRNSSREHHDEKISPPVQSFTELQGQRKQQYFKMEKGGPPLPRPQA